MPGCALAVVAVHVGISLHPGKDDRQWRQHHTAVAAMHGHAVYMQVIVLGAARKHSWDGGRSGTAGLTSLPVVLCHSDACWQRSPQGR